MNHFGVSMNTNNMFYGGTLPDSHTICTSQWLNQQHEWGCISSVCKPISNALTPESQNIHSMQPPPLRSMTALPIAISLGKEPIWKRRGAKPIKPLQFQAVIRGDINWIDKATENEELLEIVNDSEWTAIQPNYFEVHSLKDVDDGIVIDPPTYPALYRVASTGSNVPALLPFSSDVLLNLAFDEGYAYDRLIRTMGRAIADYSTALIHRKRRSYQEILILARQTSWQGAAAITAATKILLNWVRVSVFILEQRDDSPGRFTKEEDDFIAAGGNVYRNLQDLAGKKFRVVVMALEDQYSGRKTSLPLYGEWLQHAVVVLVDPPVLKCSYSTALQMATNGCYNISQKTLLLVPCLPKAHIVDNFVEMIVVDVEISESAQRAIGVTEQIFPRTENEAKMEPVAPVEYTVKGSRLYFYKNGQRVAS